MPKFNYRALLAGVSVLLLAGCGSIAPRRVVQRNPLQARVAYDQYPAQIPFKRTPGDLPIVLAETEHGNLWMLVDTGCDAVVFSPKTAKRTSMQTKPVDAYSFDGAGNASKIDGVAQVDRLSLGPAHFYGFYSVVNDIGTLTDKDHPPGGVAGLPLFGDTLLTLDYAHDRLIIQPGELPPPDGKDILPMTLSGGKLRVLFGIGENEIPLILDTGFAGFIIIPRDQINRFPGAETRLDHGKIKCFYGTADIDLAQLRDDLHVGRHTIQQPIIAVSDTGKAMIGAQYLKHFVITIDQRNRRIRFASPDKRSLFLPAYGREAEHEITMLDRLMQRPVTRPTELPTTQPSQPSSPAAGVDADEIKP